MRTCTLEGGRWALQHTPCPAAAVLVKVHQRWRGDRAGGEEDPRPGRGGDRQHLVAEGTVRPEPTRLPPLASARSPLPRPPPPPATPPPGPLCPAPPGPTRSAPR